MLDGILRIIKKIIPGRIFRMLEPYYHFFLAFLSAVFYLFPSCEMKVVGVTGTSGKTTTIEFLHAIFQSAGYKTASLSSLRFKILDKEEPNMLKMTLPGRFRVQKFLKDAKNKGAEYVFLEVTSEGIKQFRHKFINFYAAILTNLSEEHIESHGGFANYRAAKGEIFKKAPLVILNGDDPNLEYFYEISPKEKIVFVSSDFPEDIDVKIPGSFNKMNALSALTFAKREGVSPEDIRKGIEAVKGVSGRMEFVSLPEVPVNFKVLVDYAFLPQTLEKVYEILSGTVSAKKLVCVIGAAGGGRDRWKRPLLGNIAAKYCRKVFVTNEDPYDEDPMEIIDQIAGPHNFQKILDRRKAIRQALKSAEDGDVVVVTGKGAEPWIMGPNGSRTPWDDRAVIKEELGNLFSLPES